jgi:hypothetical protein
VAAVAAPPATPIAAAPQEEDNLFKDVLVRPRTEVDREPGDF